MKWKTVLNNPPPFATRQLMRNEKGYKWLQDIGSLTTLVLTWEWLDESEQELTEKDMIDFAEFMFSWCKSYARPGFYHTTDDKYLSAEELLKQFFATRIRTI